VAKTEKEHGNAVNCYPFIDCYMELRVVEKCPVIVKSNIQFSAQHPLLDSLHKWETLLCWINWISFL